ncbi:MAG: hypothetical protein RL277_2061, partial [Planctomycetota bacterium]
MKQAVLMVRGVSLALALGASAASAQQVMWKDNPITGKVVGLTYGTSGWNAAEAQAVAYGGHLAAIRSQSEQDLLAQQFSTSWSVNFAGTAHGPWFGLNDAAQHSSWVYPSGDPVPYTFWAPGQGPSQPAGTIENYALLAFATENWRWHDAAEYATLRSLIEVSQRPPRSWSWPAVTGSVPQSLYAHSCDLDLDGDIDLVVPALNQVFFYTNNGLGLFSLKQTVPGCGSATKAVAGDFDLDGDLDVAVTDFSDAKRVLLLHQNA